jgi:phosphotransferase system IIB component
MRNTTHIRKSQTRIWRPKQHKQNGGRSNTDKLNTCATHIFFLSSEAEATPKQHQQTKIQSGNLEAEETPTNWRPKQHQQIKHMRNTTHIRKSQTRIWRPKQHQQNGGRSNTDKLNTCATHIFFLSSEAEATPKQHCSSGGRSNTYLLSTHNSSQLIPNIMNQYIMNPYIR